MITAGFMEMNSNEFLVRWPVVLACSLLVTACGSSEALQDAAPRPDRPAGEPTALLGKCELADTGGECTGVPEEQRAFVPLQAGDSVAMVTGPQGSTMFVLALRTTGMYPGDPDSPASPDNPDVTIVVTLPDGELLGRYKGRPVFELEPQTQQLTAAGLFVVLDERATELLGMSLQASASVVDRDGVFRWAEVEFSVVR